MSEKEFIKYPEIGYLKNKKEIRNRELHIFEKLDGSNVQIRRMDWRLFPGRRSGYLDGRMWENLYGVKSWMGDFKKWTLKNETLYYLPENIVLFGEWLHKKMRNLGGIQINYPESAYDKFYLIDMGEINDLGQLERMIPYDEGANLIEALDLKDIRIIPFEIRRNPSRKDLENLLVNGIAEKIAMGIPEGIVMKDYNADQFFARKLVSVNYEERSRKEKDPRKKYCTLPRIRKRYLELWDTIGPDITPENLANSVIEDIKKEEGVNSDRRYVLKKSTEFLKRVGS